MNYVNKYKKDFGGKVDWNAKVDKDTTLKDFVMEKVKEDMTVKYTNCSHGRRRGHQNR